MTKALAAPLTLVPHVSQSNAGNHDPKPLSAAERAKASAAAAKADADAALAEFVALLNKVVSEAENLATVDTLPEVVRSEIKKFAVNTNGSLNNITPRTR